MHVAEASLDFETVPDPAFPESTPPDPTYPCQTLEPLRGLLDGIATPAMWTRLASALDRALDEIWDELRLQARGRPRRWAAIHFGCIALNAHGWERLRASALDLEPDRALAGPEPEGLQLLAEWWELLRLRFSRPRLQERLQLAQERGQTLLERARSADLASLATPEVARGLLDERSWTELLIPALGARLLEEEPRDHDVVVRLGIALEQRCCAEVGRRLVTSQVLESPTDVAYLTVEERIRAVNEASVFWQKLVAARRARIEAYTELRVPEQFWGRPRVEREKDA